MTLERASSERTDEKSKLTKTACCFCERELSIDLNARPGAVEGGFLSEINAPYCDEAHAYLQVNN